MALSKLVLSIGPVTIPVRIENVIGKGTKPEGNYVCRTSKTPYKTIGATGGLGVCQEKHDGACERTVGYDRGDETFFVPSDDQLDEITDEKTRTINLETFVPVLEVDPAYFEKTYVVKADSAAPAEAVKVLDLLSSRLKIKRLIGIGTATLDKEERMVFLRYSEEFNALFFVVGVFDEQVKRGAISKISEQVRFKQTEVRLMDQILTQVFVGDFNPSNFQPERWHKLNALIAAERVKVETPLPKTDLMEQLQQTIERGKKAKGKVKS